MVSASTAPRVGSTELSRAARMNTPTPPKCRSIEISDVTGPMIRLISPPSTGSRLLWVGAAGDHERRLQIAGNLGRIGGAYRLEKALNKGISAILRLRAKSRCFSIGCVLTPASNPGPSWQVRSTPPPHFAWCSCSCPLTGLTARPLRPRWS